MGQTVYLPLWGLWACSALGLEVKRGAWGGPEDHQQCLARQLSPKSHSRLLRQSRVGVLRWEREGYLSWQRRLTEFRLRVASLVRICLYVPIPTVPPPIHALQQQRFPVRLGTQAVLSPSRLHEPPRAWPPAVAAAARDTTTATQSAAPSVLLAALHTQPQQPRARARQRGG